MDYKILCEDCKCDLGDWKPNPELTYSEADIIYHTQTGYLCDNCAKKRSEAQDDGA